MPQKSFEEVASTTLPDPIIISAPAIRPGINHNRKLFFTKQREIKVVKIIKNKTGKGDIGREGVPGTQ
jgi:hypothetical protein